MEVRVIEGDIAHVRTDALIAVINSSGLWTGAIDSVIQNVAGDQFHSQARVALLHNCNVKMIVARKTAAHRGAFADVVFVIDDLYESLGIVVKRGLDTAANAGYRSISMPAFRFGKMEERGGTHTEKIWDIARAVQTHKNSYRPLDSISIVIYNDNWLAGQLRAALGSL